MQGYSPNVGLEEETVAARLRIADAGWEGWLRQLLGQVSGQTTREEVPGEDKGAAQVIFEVCLDGERYTLTRCDLHPAPSLVNLSPREKEIVRLIAKGLPNKAISEVLDISPWTVATHLRRIFGKLGVSCRAEMVARVLEEGLLGIGSRE